MAQTFPPRTSDHLNATRNSTSRVFQNRLTTRHIGLLGESIAHRYLTERGYTVIARNWRISGYGKRGEIDLIVTKNDRLSAIEVKTRTTVQSGSPAESVDSRKQSALRALISRFLEECDSSFSSIQIDVIAIQLELDYARRKVRKAQLHHLQAVC